MKNDSSLPAITAVAAIPTVATPAPATAATVPATPAAVAAAGSSATATTAAAFGLRARFVDDEIAAAKVLSVKRVNRAVGVVVAVHFDEGEAAGLSCETVPNQINTRGSDTHLRKPFLHLFFRSRERKITNI